MIEPKVAMDGLPADAGEVESVERLCRFRRELYSCLGRRADELFELTEALLCWEGRVRSPVELSLAPEHRRGHGGLYGGLNRGEVEVARLRRALAGVPLPRVGGRIVLAVDVSAWRRPDAATSSQRLHCHVGGRGRTARTVAGWPYSVVAAVESGRTSWTAVLDAVRLGPDDDPTAVTATQLRQAVARLVEAGHWRPGDPDIAVVMDSGYDVARLAFVLADLPVELIARLRSDRVMALPAPPARAPGARGRPPRHGPALDLRRPQTWPDPEHATSTETPATGPPGPPPGTGCTPG